MSSTDEQRGDPESGGDILPHQFLYYAPSSWRERLRPLSSPLSFPSSAAPPAPQATPSVTETAPAADSPDAQLEHAVYEALRRPREPSADAEPSGFFRELDRRVALISIAGRVAVAIGFSAIAALVFVSMLPAVRDGAGQGMNDFSGSARPTNAALRPSPPATEDAEPALCELQTILGPPQTQPSITREQSETLLQQFVRWGQKPTVGKPP